MLVHLAIHHYATIEHLDLELQRGMSVITGETGAGKSIMVDALGLALGDRADSSAVRPGSERAEILASFELGQLPEAVQWLAEHDLQREALCILRRVITAEGRSRAYINGIPCPQTDLKSLGSLLIDIHSQHEHQSLLKTDTHRRLLDEYCGAQALAEQVRHSAQQWQQLGRQLEQLQRSVEAQQARQQLLHYQHEELEQLALIEGEVEQLEQEHRQLADAGQLLGACRQVLDLCVDNEAGNVRSALMSSLHKLSSLSNRPKMLEEAFNLLSSAQIQVDEAASELQRFIDHFNLDPEHQQRLESRLNALYSLARKHRVPPTELPALQQRLAAELDSASGQGERMADLEQQREALATRYRQHASALSQQRQQAAQGLASAVEREIHRLGMPNGRLDVQLMPLEGDQPHPQGQEQVSFLVSANPGQPLRPLAKVASGGELSRISLAIQVITAQTSSIPTLIFDEVDVGIGGPTAEVVGQLLRRLGERGQVLTVTHLPQVAAQGHQHLYVHKASDAHETRTCIRHLETQQRVKEVARMLGGTRLTEESLAHAQAMLEAAQG